MVRIGAGDSVTELARRVAPEGDLLDVERSDDALQRLRKATTVSNVFYLVGSAAEFFRVLRPGGEVVIAAGDQDHTRAALNLNAHEVERLFIDAGFAGVTVAAAQGRLAVAARKP